MTESVLISAADAVRHADQYQFIDATWYLPSDDRVPAETFAAERIPGAVRHDIDQVKDPENELPHMVPPPEVFARWMGEAGLSSDQQFIIYDQNAFMAGPRVWWMFRRFGLNAMLLNGRLDGWRAAGEVLEALRGGAQ